MRHARLFTALLLVSLLAAGFTDTVSGQTSKKNGKSKKKQIISEHHTVSPCDFIFAPWGTPVDVLLKKVKQSGAKNIEVDSLDANGKHFVAIGFEDDYNRYMFACREGYGFAIATVYEYYKTALDTQKMFDQLCVEASANYGISTINQPNRKGFSRACSKFTGTLVLTLVDDKQLVYTYGSLPLE